MQNPGSAAKNDNKANNPMGGSKSNADVGALHNEGNRDSNLGSNRDSSLGSSNVGSMDSGTIAKKAEATVTNLKDGVSNFTHKAQEKLTDVGHKAQEYGGKAVDETRTFVRNNPGQALLIGFGAGLLIGYGFARK